MFSSMPTMARPCQSASSEARLSSWQSWLASKFERLPAHAQFDSALLDSGQIQDKFDLGKIPMLHGLFLRVSQTALGISPFPYCILCLVSAPSLHAVGARNGGSPLKLRNHIRGCLSGPSFKLKQFLTIPISFKGMCARLALFLPGCSRLRLKSSNARRNMSRLPQQFVSISAILGCSLFSQTTYAWDWPWTSAPARTAQAANSAENAYQTSNPELKKFLNVGLKDSRCSFITVSWARPTAPPELLAQSKNVHSLKCAGDITVDAGTLRERTGCGAFILDGNTLQTRPFGASYYHLDFEIVPKPCASGGFQELVSRQTPAGKIGDLLLSSDDLTESILIYSQNASYVDWYKDARIAREDQVKKNLQKNIPGYSPPNSKISSGEPLIAH